VALQSFVFMQTNLDRTKIGRFAAWWILDTLQLFWWTRLLVTQKTARKFFCS
jgi:hypothetical protein